MIDLGDELAGWDEPPPTRNTSDIFNNGAMVWRAHQQIKKSLDLMKNLPDNTGPW